MRICCLVSFPVFNPEERHVKDQIGRDGLEMFIVESTAQSGALIARKRCIGRASGVGGILLVNG